MNKLIENPQMLKEGDKQIFMYQKQKSKRKKIIEIVSILVLFLLFFIVNFLYINDKNTPLEDSILFIFIAAILETSIISVIYYVIDYIIYYNKLSAIRKEK